MNPAAVLPTVADIVLANPDAARVFEKHEIDFAATVAARSPMPASTPVPTSVVQAELDALDAPAAAVAVPDGVGELIDHIVVTHHEYLRRELPRLHELMGKVVNAHAERHPEVHDVALALEAIEEDLLPHLLKEEHALFPMAKELVAADGPVTFGVGSVLHPIRVMHTEHDEVGELLATLHHRTNCFTPPDDACPTWQALYAGLAELEHDVHTHVHLENNVLFPKILELEAAHN
ncbi:MAG: hemerythrin domain-containing protein [Ilumatobacteraceae bacterium]